MRVRHYSILTVCVTILSTITCFVAFAETAAMEKTPENGVTAHRGNSSEYPESSIIAFESAILLGSDWIELDVFKTADGKLVICHDPRTKEVADADLAVSESTLEQLRKLDMAVGFRRNRKLTEAECPKLQIPLLEDVIRLVLRYKKARVSIQPKNDCVDAIIETVRNLDAIGWVGFNDGNLKWMSRVKELEPTIPVFWDRFDWNADQDIETAKKIGFETLVVHYNKLSDEQIRQVKAAGLKIGVWTVNDPALMKKFLARGIDRFYTDQPRMLLSIKADGKFSFAE